MSFSMVPVASGRGGKVQLGRAPALLASSATGGPEERRAGEPGPAHLEEVPAR